MADLERDQRATLALLEEARHRQQDRAGLEEVRGNVGSWQPWLSAPMVVGLVPRIDLFSGWYTGVF